MNPRSLHIVALVALALSGCTDSTSPGSGRSVGVIQRGSRSLGAILSPDTVQVGAVFQATVNTWGSSSCTIPDGVDLTLQGNLAIVTPYDRSPTGNAVCTADISPRPHHVTLRFTSAGAATIQAIGYRLDGSGRALTSVDRSVTVVP